MLTAALTVDPAYRVGEVDPRLFGSFVEHMGRCVYTGIFEPGHPTADADGFRGDVADLVRELGVPIVRYPGGNFVSGYRWEDGIGPVDQRPARLDLAWRSIEPNRVGVDEFHRWAATVGTGTMMAVNLGTRGIDAARALVEYCNLASGTYWSDLRRRNGSAQPYGVKVWCLGNEMDGPWQIGHKTAVEYARLAHETGKAMRQVDPSIELVACGSSSLDMPTFGTWESTVLSEAYDVVDYVSMHGYYQQHGDDRDSFLAAATGMDRFIDAVVATADHVRAVGRHRKRIDISFDEWNVWYQSRFAAETNLEVAATPRLIEDVYSVTDAVVVGNLLISLLRHADRVRIGCQAQLVNVIASIMTEPGGPAWRQAIFHPYALTSRHARGTVLQVPVRSPMHETAAFGEVPLLDAVAVAGDDGPVLFAVNRHQHEPMSLDADLRGFGGLTSAAHTALADDDPEAVNDRLHPDRVQPRRLDDPKLDGGRMLAVLPPMSWNMIRLS
ncbi:arabinosylfuranosidase ArfA [Mangrovihabitans endophyticus]|uniref:non-reducing end alpha-L-arabinofuranosidase n=1 Tax=Mangrovihabitans endophyticus TaxID=1751298 RepID=A0A8J3C3B1_9ACTN|nr:alpha-N-arabinofuranosidase [Mangrovihabitans endophyticus]GGL08930.1 alpha-N-arabinofuranosidase [Mangrovihabitans endophyticus]